MKKNYQYLATTISFVVMTMGIWVATEMAAKADHSLASAMSDSEVINQAVTQIQSSHNVICDTESSNQIYHHPNEEGELGTAWKQIALCFRDNNSLQKTRAHFVNGNPLGFYGASGIAGVLVVSYTWEDYQAGKLISIEYK